MKKGTDWSKFILETIRNAIASNGHGPPAPPNAIMSYLELAKWVNANQQVVGNYTSLAGTCDKEPCELPQTWCRIYESVSNLYLNYTGDAWIAPLDEDVAPKYLSIWYTDPQFPYAVRCELLGLHIFGLIPDLRYHPIWLFRNQDDVPVQVNTIE